MTTDPQGVTIHVYLLHEGIDVWRPVQAQHLGGDRYRITSINEDPEGEHWQFKTGEVVRCSTRELLSDQAVLELVAHERVD